jgi:hypothetical protein
MNAARGAASGRRGPALLCELLAEFRDVVGRGSARRLLGVDANRVDHPAYADATSQLLDQSPRSVTIADLGEPSAEPRRREMSDSRMAWSSLTRAALILVPVVLGTTFGALAAVLGRFVRTTRC